MTARLRLSSEMETGPKSWGRPSTIIRICLSRSSDRAETGGADVRGSGTPRCFLLPNDPVVAIDDGVVELTDMLRVMFVARGDCRILATL